MGNFILVTPPEKFQPSSIADLSSSGNESVNVRNGNIEIYVNGKLEVYPLTHEPYARPSMKEEYEQMMAERKKLDDSLERKRQVSSNDMTIKHGKHTRGGGLTSEATY